MRKWHVWAGVLALCVFIGVVAIFRSAPKRPTEADAIKMIRATGGYYCRQDSQPNSPITEVNLGKATVSNADLKILRELKHLTILNLEDTPITDAGLKELNEFQMLSRLSLAGTQVSDAGLLELLPLRSLTSLNLHRTPVTDPGLRILVGLPRLNELKLPHDRVTDATLHALAEVDLLHVLGYADGRRPTNASETRELYLRSREVTDNGLAILSKLPNLVRLTLSNSGVTDVGMKDVAQLTKLTSLDLTATRVTFKGLRELRGLTQLETLYLTADQVTNESIEALIDTGLLHTLTHCIGPFDEKRPRSTDEVRFLRLANTQVTMSGLKCLRRLPKLMNLDLSHTRWTENGLATVRELEQLESLNVSMTDVSDEGLKLLRDLKRLGQLDLTYTKVTDAGLSELMGLTRLKYLRVDDHLVTDRSLKSLADAGLVHALVMATNHLSFRPTKESEVYRLDLYGTRVTGAGIKELKNLKQLKELRLNPRQVTDESLKTLAEFGMLHALDRTHPEGPPFGEPWSEKWSAPKNADEIWILNLHECEVTDASLKEVAALKKLKSLNLCGTRVTEAGLMDFPDLTRLSSLAVDQKWVTDRLLKRFADAGRVHVLEAIVYEPGWPQPKSDAEVRAVNLSGTSVTHESLKDLRRFKRLISLQLNEKQLNDAALKLLAEMKMLHTLHRAQGKSEKQSKNANEILALNLRNCNVSDTSLKVLATLQCVRFIDLRDTQVTGAGLKSLRAALPDCEILH